ncbi:MAG: hypothetical protein ACJA0N_001095 [Pseudohongiellaceae bacterium]
MITQHNKKGMSMLELGWLLYKLRYLPLLLLVLIMSACGGGGGSDHGAGGQAAEEGDYDNARVYKAESSYAGLLTTCALVDNTADSCSLSDLPLLVEEARTPSVDQIMDRVIVSHQWMGVRFQQTIETYPGELLRIFSSVATIVIDDDIRPSYYDPYTSTIYLDAAYLWQTNAEKATISQDEDFRSGFDDELDFVSLARYVEGFNDAWDYYALDDNIERGVNDLRLNFARLLLHELMHANDFFPPNEIETLNQNQTLYEALQSLRSKNISTQLNAVMPLGSTLMYGLADVMYSGDNANAEQQQLSAAEVGEEMESDGANDGYGYSSQYEDVAMLFSEAMMKYFFDVDRDIAYTNRPGDNAFCDDYIVGWGMRGRMGDVNVKDRAQFVVESVYADLDFSLFFQNLPAPIMMRAGETWCDNLAVF